MKKLLVISIIGILLGVTLVQVVSGMSKEKHEMVNVTCRIFLSKNMKEITTMLPIDRVIKIQKERNMEVVFALLKEYSIIPKNSSISFLRNEFQKTINENSMLVKNLKYFLLNGDNDIFYNLLCFMRVDWTFETTFFVPLFMFGNSPVRGWINFPIWMIFGWFLLQPFFEYIPLLTSLFFISLLIPSTDIVDIGIGGRFDYDVKTVGLLGKKTFDNHHKPLMFSLVGFHGYHIIFEFMPEYGIMPHRQDTFIGFALATVIIPKNN